jgi:hypothetical protein
MRIRDQRKRAYRSSKVFYGLSRSRSARFGPSGPPSRVLFGPARKADVRKVAPGPVAIPGPAVRAPVRRCAALCAVITSEAT